MATKGAAIARSRAMANAVGIQGRGAFVRQDSDQNSSLNANCKSRLSLMVLVIRPAEGEPMAAFGKPKFGVLKALKASSRICARRRSRITVFFTSERSQSTVLGP